MRKQDVVVALGALGQEVRMDIFLFLIQAGSKGVPAGKIAEQVAVSPAALSFHLRTLKHAGLVEARREGRSIVYVSRSPVLHGLIHYLSSQSPRERVEMID